MSAFTDAFRILDGETNILAFLPAVNQGYVYWKTANPSDMQAAIFVGSLLISVIAFNVLTYGNFSQYQDSSETMEVRYALILIVFTVIWGMALGFSLLQLSELASSGELWPLLLSAISLLFLLLIITHILLSWALPMYNSKQ